METLLKERDEVIPSEAAGRYTPQLRDRLKIWLINVMKQRGWSAERWARLAGIAPTTITRFLNSNDLSRVPSARTLEKLARAAGVPAMHEEAQVSIAIISKSQLLDEALNRGLNQVDVFSMVSDAYLPALPKYADCKLAQMDNGRYAILRRQDYSRGDRVLVQRDNGTICPYYYEPPVLVPVEMSASGPHTLPLYDPAHRILGCMVGEFIDYNAMA
jgi:transcriptional regulator with XRE-family HTH domain